MNKKNVRYFVGAVVIATAFYFFKSKPEKSQLENTQKENLQDGPGIEGDSRVNVPSTGSSLDQTSKNLTAATSAAQKTQETNDAVGSAQAPKDEFDYEPDNKTIKNAHETLVSKRDLDPAAEIIHLALVDTKNVNNLMLGGYFRDDTNDIEAAFSATTDENGERLPVDSVCFMAPNLGIKYPTTTGKLTVRADEMGYAMVKLSDTQYIRMMWSFEDKHRLHGAVVVIENGAHRVVKNFDATAVHLSKGEQPKYCK